MFSAVWCVRFSADGEYLATACERTARIYDAKTGAKIWFGPFLVDGPLALTSSLLHSGLVHETMSVSIYSVCFSPDGKLLATGALDRAVRVSSRIIILAIVIAVIIIFGANLQHRMTFGTLDLGYRQEADLQNISGSHRYSPLGHFLVGWGVGFLWVR